MMVPGLPVRGTHRCVDIRHTYQAHLYGNVCQASATSCMAPHLLE